jgi:hypothetical protein
MIMLALVGMELFSNKITFEEDILKEKYKLL